MGWGRDGGASPSQLRAGKGPANRATHNRAIEIACRRRIGVRPVSLGVGLSPLTVP